MVVKVNVQKIVGLVSVILGLVAVAYPFPDIVKVYILGTETVINGGLQYYYGQAGSTQNVQPAQPKPAGK